VRFDKIASGYYHVLVQRGDNPNNYEIVGRVRKRTESYRGIRNSRGRRMGTYTYWDAYRGTECDPVVRGARTRYEAVEGLLT
jgi:hypothetical protein